MESLPAEQHLDSCGSEEAVSQIAWTGVVNLRHCGDSSPAL